MIDDPKQIRDSQLIALSLVLIGLIAIAFGCHYHWAELTTTASGVSGGGLMMLRSSFTAGKTAAAPEPTA